MSEPFTIEELDDRLAADDPIDAVEEALAELTALSAGGWSPSTYRGLLHYVTEATRQTVRSVTGLTVREGDRWTAADMAVAIAALKEALA